LTFKKTLVKIYLFLFFELLGMKDRIEGIIIESLPGTNFLVELKDGEKILAYLSGKMRLYHIKVLPGDKVLLEISPDGKRGRIVKRL